MRQHHDDRSVLPAVKCSVFQTSIDKRYLDCELEQLPRNLLCIALAFTFFFIIALIILLLAGLRLL